MRTKPNDNQAVVGIFDKQGFGPNVEGLLSAWRTSDLPIFELVVRAATDLIQCEDDLRTMAARIRRDLDAMEEMLVAGYNLNTSGILQRSGPELDALAARRQHHAELLNSLLWVLKREGEVKA